jgi:hypothetical protein
MKRNDAIKELDEGCKKLEKQSESNKVRYLIASAITSVVVCLGIKKMGDYAYSAGCKDGTRKMAEAVKTDYEIGKMRMTDPDWDDE